MSILSLWNVSSPRSRATTAITTVGVRGSLVRMYVSRHATSPRLSTHVTRHTCHDRGTPDTAHPQGGGGHTTREDEQYLRVRCVGFMEKYAIRFTLSVTVSEANACAAEPASMMHVALCIPGSLHFQPKDVLSRSTVLDRTRLLDSS